MARITAVIPARKGSKGIPNKNIMQYKDKPLLLHSINHAHHSRLIDSIICSTDCPEIASLAVKNGADAPYLRPSAYSTDTSLDYPIFYYHIKYLLDNHLELPDLFVHLRPTCPERPDGLIDECIERLLDDPHATAIRSVNRVSQHPYRMYYKSAGGLLQPFVCDQNPWPYELRRQDLPVLFYYNCCVDVVKTTTILQFHSMTGPNLIAYEMSEPPLDIDGFADIPPN
jgi:CMP-N,N'-diacetyllegionaminic acid synthase